MTRQYKPRAMPRRFLEDAPAIVRANVLDVIAIKPAAPLDYDVILRADVPPESKRLASLIINPRN